MKTPRGTIAFAKQGCEYLEEGGDRKLYYNPEHGWIIVNGKDYYPISSVENADCCPENLERSNLLPGFSVVPAPEAVPFFRYG